MAPSEKELTPFICFSCQQSCRLSLTHPHFCPFCGLPADQTTPQPKIPEQSYKILKSIGKGGMGEVFLAFDPTCKRKIAIKKIRSDLLDHPQIRARFLKEALITCQLTHPAIIPIYSLQSFEKSLYYTMPFVEGETLKQILRKTRLQEKKGEKLDHIGGSIPALMRIFLTVCQAIGYAHSRKIIHRDLKPENIIIGKYGEVLILDWGLAKQIDTIDTIEESAPEIERKNTKELTRIGKVVGTVSYMAPERAQGHPANFVTDIYSLGVILYHLLTLQSPYKRGTLEEFRKSVVHETWTDPVTIAPYRDVPKQLANISEKCLSINPENRYRSVDELIIDLENYVEGRSEWFEYSKIDVKQRKDWEFQENILLAEHLAISPITEESEWVSMMISHQSFGGNVKIETEVCIGEHGRGLGFLFNIPETSQRSSINEGYCLWLASENQKTTKILRTNVDVLNAPDVFLKTQQWYRIRIEKIENNFHLYINNILQLSYIAHLPLIGTHIGLLSRDVDFDISEMKIFLGSSNIMVSCLSVPDAFLAHREYSQALSEYHRIANSFPDRPEGREALFRAGLTYIEQAKLEEKNSILLDLALEQFEKLHGTPGAPLGYLGKSLIYQLLSDSEEEVKCFEIAYRRYPKHPLIPLLQEQMISRLHVVSKEQRKATYRFLLLIARHFPLTALDTHTKRLFTSLQKHWEQLPFIEEETPSSHPCSYQRVSIQLAFWLAQPYLLNEMIIEMNNNTSSIHTIDSANSIFCLLQLGSWTLAEKRFKQLSSLNLGISKGAKRWLEGAIMCHQLPIEEIFQNYFAFQEALQEPHELRSLLYVIDQLIDQNQPHHIHKFLDLVTHWELSFEAQLSLNKRRIWAYLLENNWKEAGEILYAYPMEFVNKESSMLFFLYCSWTAATEGLELSKILFAGIDMKLYPRSWTLGAHYLAGFLSDQWFSEAFLWEKRQLYRELILYFHCIEDEEQKHFYYEQFLQQFTYVDI